MRSRKGNAYAPALDRGVNFFAADPHYRIPGRYAWLALKALHPWMQSERYERWIPSFPATPEAVLAANATYNDQVSVAPGSFFQMISGSTTEAAGFRFQLSDVRTGETLLDYPVNMANLAGSPVPPFNQPTPFVLPSGGHPFPKGGQLMVKITNLANTENLVQLALFFARPIGGGHVV